MGRVFAFRSMFSWRSLVRKFSSHEPIRHWYPTRFLTEEKTDSNFALLILNSRPTPDAADSQYIQNLWPKAKIRACADGGANRLANLNKELGTAFYPDFICGDLDSAEKENIDLFQKHGSAIYKETCQDSTDYTKSARVLAKLVRQDQKPEIDTIVTIGGLYGRFDHVMGCIHTLFLLQKEFPKLIVYCLLNRSMFTLLPPGSHTIHVDLDATTGVCGLVPIGGPAKSVTTSGLEWNLNKQALAFGTLISTSNHIKASEVQITTDAPLLWILNLKS